MNNIKYEFDFYDEALEFFKTCIYDEERRKVALRTYLEYDCDLLIDEVFDMTDDAKAAIEDRIILEAFENWRYEGVYIHEMDDED